MVEGGSARKTVYNRAFRPVVAVAGFHQVAQHVAQALQFRNLPVDRTKLCRCHRFDIRALAIPIAVQRQKLTALLHREAEASRALEEAQAMNVLDRIVAIAVFATVGRDQPDVLGVADSLGR